MVGRSHTIETVELLNVNSIHLSTLYDGRSWSYQRNRRVVNCNSLHLNTLFDGRSWSYHKNRGIVKCKLYTFKHPFR
jgi:hypothetical protein